MLTNNIVSFEQLGPRSNVFAGSLKKWIFVFQRVSSEDWSDYLMWRLIWIIAGVTYLKACFISCISVVCRFSRVKFSMCADSHYPDHSRPQWLKCTSDWWSGDWSWNIFYITKTRLFKYNENFTAKNWKFSDKNTDIIHIYTHNIDCGYSLELP